MIQMQLTNRWSWHKAQIILRYQPSVKPGKRNKITNTTNHNQHSRHKQPPPNLALEKRFRSTIKHRTQPHKVKKPVSVHSVFRIVSTRRIRNNRIPSVAATRRNNLLVRNLVPRSINANIISSEPVGEFNRESPVQLRRRKIEITCVECRNCKKWNPSSNSVDAFHVSSFCKQVLTKSA